MVSFLSKIALVLAVSFIIAAAGSLFLDIDKDKRTDLVQYGLDNPFNASGAVAKTVIGYDLTTPSWENEWIGNNETKIFILEDTPYPDSRDLFILIPYWFLSFLLIRFLFQKKALSTPYLILIAILLFTAGTILVWILWKILWFYLMKSGAEQLGIKDEILNARSKVNGKVEKGATWLLLITIFNSIILARTLWPGGGDS